MKHSDALDLVAVIQAAYPRQPWPDPTVNLYADELARFPLEPEAATALIRAMIRERSSEWAPSIGEIVQHLIAAMDGAPSFDEAWAELARKASNGNYFRPDEAPAFSHPAIDALARLIGWRTFTGAPASDAFLRRSAERVYGGVLEDRTRIALTSPERIRALGRGDVPAEMHELVEGIGGGA